MKFIRIFFALLLTAGLGCAKPVLEGRKIDSSKTQAILGTYKTADQIVQAFGRPYRVESLAPGEQKYIYRYVHKKPHWWTSDEVDEQKLEILIRNGQVQSYHLQETASEPITTSTVPR